MKNLKNERAQKNMFYGPGPHQKNPYTGKFQGKQWQLKMCLSN